MAVIKPDKQPACCTSRTAPIRQAVEMTNIFSGFCRYFPVTVFNRRCSISIPAVARLLRLGFHSSDSYGYHFRSKPAPHRLRIPPALEMLVQHAG